MTALYYKAWGGVVVKLKFADTKGGTFLLIFRDKKHKMVRVIRA